MCSLTITIAVTMHFKTDLVPLMVGVDWRGVPLIIISLVLWKVGHGQNRRTQRYSGMRDIVSRGFSFESEFVLFGLFLHSRNFIT